MVTKLFLLQALAASFALARPSAVTNATVSSLNDINDSVDGADGDKTVKDGLDTSPPPANQTMFFNLTAIATTANGSACLQCWQLTDPIQTSQTKGITGAIIASLGDLSNATYSTLPANFPGSPHPAPNVQYVLFISGKTSISIPPSKDEYIFQGGPNGLLLATDTAARTEVGHISTTLSEPVVALQIPTRDGDIPEHRILYEGQCKPSELTALGSPDEVAAASVNAPVTNSPF